MSILNVTPDSFSDGGELFSSGSTDVSKVLYKAEEMIAAGATILDVGGESTRPGAAPVLLSEELDRIVGVIEKINSRFDTVISVDTSKAEVMTCAAKAGAGIINDVRALMDPGALGACASLSLPVILMHHMQGLRANMYLKSANESLLDDVDDFLAGRIAVCEQEGIKRDRLLIDPGFGFGKKVSENISLMRDLPRLQHFGLPVVVGLSRKNTISTLLGGRLPQERMAGSLALAVIAYGKGARIIRAHDVKETVDAIKIAEAFV